MDATGALTESDLHAPHCQPAANFLPHQHELPSEMWDSSATPVRVDWSALGLQPSPGGNQAAGDGAADPPFLEADETSVQSASSTPDLANIDPTRIAELHQSFRHSFWQVRRSATRSALQAAGVTPSRLMRFCGCGATAWVLRSDEPQPRYRLATNRCRDRWCEACGVERRNTIASNLRETLRGVTIRLLTLTLKSQPGPLADRISRLNDCWRRFRRNKKIKAAMDGGVAFYEITYSHAHQSWHTHLHVMFSGNYLPHEVAKQTWLDVTGDSYIVDVRAVRDSDQAAGYVAKYATKSLSADVWRHPHLFVEAITALKGTRTFATFGSWSKLGLSKVPESDCVWEAVQPLWRLLADAKAGCETAIAILRQLRGPSSVEPTDLPQDGPTESG